ncbi:sugar transferase [Streptomyces lavendulae]|uniref:sugar transferase n=1 Tax=Streptomyces lavendulae TaxID=1914 RepID=UPI0036AE2536
MDLLAAMVSVAPVPWPDLRLATVAPVGVAAVALHARAGLYHPRLTPSALLELPVLAARTAVVWCGLAAVLAAVLPQRTLGWQTLLACAGLHLLVASTGRGLVNRLRVRAAMRSPRGVLVVGPGEGAAAVAGTLYERPEYGLCPVGLTDTRTGGARAGAAGLPLLLTQEEVRRAVVQHSVRDTVFIRRPEADEQGHTASLVRLLHDHGCRLWLADPEGTPAMTGIRTTRPADHLWGHAVRPLLPCSTRTPGRYAKRAADFVMALVALLAVAPVMGACALAVRLSDGPGVIFRQERVGLYGRPFTLLKFRTLRADEHESATRWTVAGDRRMSPVGSFLRKSSLDELPQLWNVVRGDMSLVGPRPERPFFVAKFASMYPGYEARHRMPVGITGLAQINGLRGDTSIEDRARFDNHYIDTWSLWQDVCILARTMTAFLRFRLGGG